MEMSLRIYGEMRDTESNQKTINSFYLKKITNYSDLFNFFLTRLVRCCHFTENFDHLRETRIEKRHTFGERGTVQIRHKKRMFIMDYLGYAN